MEVVTEFNRNVTLYSYQRKSEDEIFNSEASNCAVSSASGAARQGDVPAVAVRGLHMAYTKSNYVLQGVDMTVAGGCIYGLLGSSGCGKTTLLRCITGSLQPQSGQVLVFGKASGKCLLFPTHFQTFPDVSRPIP